MHFLIRVYILTNHEGEWWEYLKTDGSLDRFKAGSDRYKKDKSFADGDKARQHAERVLTPQQFPTKDGKQRRFQIVEMSPPRSEEKLWPNP